MCEDYAIGSSALWFLVSVAIIDSMKSRFRGAYLFQRIWHLSLVDGAVFLFPIRSVLIESRVFNMEVIKVCLQARKMMSSAGAEPGSSCFESWCLSSELDGTSVEPRLSWFKFDRSTIELTRRWLVQVFYQIIYLGLQFQWLKLIIWKPDLPAPQLT